MQIDVTSGAKDLRISFQFLVCPFLRALLPRTENSTGVCKILNYGTDSLLQITVPIHPLALLSLRCFRQRSGRSASAIHVDIRNHNGNQDDALDHPLPVCADAEKIERVTDYTQEHYAGHGAQDVAYPSK